MKKNNKKIKFKILLLMSVIITLFLTGYSIGKETSNVTILSKGEIAKPVVIVDNNPEIHITSQQNKGNYYFTIRNYEEEGIVSQVEMEYEIEILGEIDDSIVLNLYQEEKIIPIQNRKTQKINLGKNEKQEHAYCLEIIYDKEKSKSFSDILQEIQVKVHAEQKRGGIFETKKQ